MMNLWIFYSLAGLLALGLGDYIKKLVLSQGGNKELFLLICFLLYLPIFAINMLLQGSGDITQTDMRDGIILGLTDFLIPLGMLTALKYLNVSFALVSIRLLSSFVLLFVGVVILGDNLSIGNILGFCMGAYAIFLLSGFDLKNIGKLHPKGLIGMGMCIIGIILSHGYLKYVVADANIHDLMFVKFSITFVCICVYIFLRKKYKTFTLSDAKKIIPYALITAVLFVAHFLYFLPNMYLLGPLSLSYKILSYSLLVPIILSVIFLGEKLNKRKIFALILTIISIALFI